MPKAQRTLSPSKWDSRLIQWSLGSVTCAHTARPVGSLEPHDPKHLGATPPQHTHFQVHYTCAHTHVHTYNLRQSLNLSGMRAPGPPHLKTDKHK